MPHGILSTRVRMALQFHHAEHDDYNGAAQYLVVGKISGTRSDKAF